MYRFAMALLMVTVGPRVTRSKAEPRGWEEPRGTQKGAPPPSSQSFRHRFRIVPEA